MLRAQGKSALFFLVELSEQDTRASMRLVKAFVDEAEAARCDIDLRAVTSVCVGLIVTFLFLPFL